MPPYDIRAAARDRGTGMAKITAVTRRAAAAGAAAAACGRLRPFDLWHIICVMGAA